jgi:hypothetical protein
MVYDEDSYTPSDSAFHYQFGGSISDIYDVPTDEWSFRNFFTSHQPSSEGIVHAWVLDDFTLPVMAQAATEATTNDKKLSLELEVDFLDNKGITHSATALYASANNRTAFTPLFEITELHNDLDNARRFGLRDVGGDGWGQIHLVNWLADETNLVFNDLSSIHGARNIHEQKSIFGHTSHSSGLDVDSRYADGLEVVGDYRDIDYNSFTFVDYNCRDANIKLKELSNLAITDDDAKAKLVNWIATNRFLLGFYYDQLYKKFPTTDGVIYFGMDLEHNGDMGMNNMLVKGSYYDNTTNNATGAGTWGVYINSDFNKTVMSKNAPQNYWHMRVPPRK